MYTTVLNTIAKNKTGWLLSVSLTAFFYGTIVVFLFFKLPPMYAVFCSIATMFPFAAIAINDTKRLLWLCLLICLPVTVDITINHTHHTGGAAGYVISVYDIILSLLYFLWIAELLKKRRISIRFFPRISIPAIFLLIFASLSILPSRYPAFSVYEIIEIVKMYLTYIYLANNIKTRSDVEFFISVFMVCLLFEGLLGFAQHRYDRPFFPTALGGPGWIDSRVKGTWVSYNDFAWYLTYFLPMAMALLFSPIKLTYRFLCLFILAVGSASLMWTNARSGWISFAAASLFVGAWVFRKLKDKREIITIFFAIISILILLAPLYPRFYNKIYSRFSANDRGSAKSRLPQMRIAYNIIKDQPLLGIGLNTYSKIMWKYDDTDEGLEQITIHPVHNIFLHITAEIGILGISGFIWFLAAIFVTGIKYARSHEGFMTYAIIGMLGGILAFLIHGLIDTESLGGKLYIFIWCFAGIISAIAIMDIENSLQEDHPNNSI